MKSIAAVFVCCFALLRAGAADESLIPAPLNSVLLKVQPGMSTNQVMAALSVSYPKVTGHMGEWSGQTGYFDYKLDERFTLSVSSVMRDGRELVHDNLLFYVFDRQTKRRVEMKLYYWDGRNQTPTLPANNSLVSSAELRNQFNGPKTLPPPISVIKWIHARIII